MKQVSLPFVFRGGKRKGAGRKPNGKRPGVAHRVREEINRLIPCHVTVRLQEGLPSLRRERERRVVIEALRAGKKRFGLTLVHYSIQSNHLHLLVEVAQAKALARGMQGLLVRIAKRLNRLWERRGKVVADRFYSRLLQTPREVRNALVYVLNNFIKHRRRLPETGLDRFASGWWFSGWLEVKGRAFTRLTPVMAATSWLLKVGWRRYGKVSIRAVPGS